MAGAWSAGERGLGGEGSGNGLGGRDRGGGGGGGGVGSDSWMGPVGSHQPVFIDRRTEASRITLATKKESHLIFPKIGHMAFIWF
jgi:hypothetical protein